MNDNDQLLEDFKKSAELFTLTPSVNVWSNVEKDILRRSRRKRIFTFIIISFSVLFLAVLISYFLFSGHTKVNLPALTFDSVVSHYTLRENRDRVTKNNESRKDSITENYTNQSRPCIVQKRSLHHIVQSSLQNSSANSTITGQTSQKIANTVNLDQKSSLGLKANTSNEMVAVLPEKENKKYNVSSQTQVVKDSTKTNPIVDSIVSARKEKLEDHARVNKWSISLGVAVAKSFSNIQEQDDYQFIERYRDSTDKEPWVCNYHLNFSYDIIPEISIYTGIGIINFEQKLLSRQMVYSFDTTPSTFPLPTPVITVNKNYFDINGDSTGVVRNRFTYLNIPLGLRYNFFPKNNFNIALQADVSFNKLISAKGYAYDQVQLQYTEDIKPYLRKWMLSYRFGIIISYAVMRNLSIELAPNYSIYPKSIYTSEYQLTNKFQQLELNLSVRYAFK
jgi:hypothetical protein